MDQVYRCSKSGLTVSLIKGLGSERDAAERELADSGVQLPLSYRALWAAYQSGGESLFLLLRNAEGRACAGVGIEQTPTRAMPGYHILRVRRFGDSLSVDICGAVLNALNELVRMYPRILRLHVQIFSRERRDEIGAVLAGLGFREKLPSTVYRHTLVIDLKPTEEEIFKKFNDTGRNSIRRTIKDAGESVVITDPIYAERLKELQQEALKRTGGDVAAANWDDALKLSREHPGLSQVFGLFFDEDKSPENLAAFGWVCNHGDHGEYRSAGSVRRANVKTPFGYLLVWDMIRWAKANGASWFDMGGVTVDDGDEPALKGISNFKRSFSRETAEVGAEWILEPRPWQARIADAVSENTWRLRRLMTRN